jgi:glutamate synthase (ferredoxin)
LHQLHDPTIERDACGVGFVADVAGRPSREIVDLVLAGLERVSHRGALHADGVSGDGAGVLLPLAPSLVPGPWCGLAMVFLRDGGDRSAVEAACRAEGIEPRGWRPVPVDPSALGESARASMPRIEQLVLDRPPGLLDAEAELRAHRARRRAELGGGVYIASLSFRTVTYKALCAAGQLASFYPELREPTLAVPFGIFHQRFSTNTAPTWERAQPFRLLCHNGEINAIEGNAAAMRARRGRLGIEGEELAAPFDETGSDSALLDNAFELLVRGGRDAQHALAMLIPPAWQHDERLDERVRDFHRYHATLVEPWDGPAAVIFTDGRVVGAALDRNGLRPLRYAVSDDGIVACASEAGAVPLRGGMRRGKLGPGQLLTVDPSVGLQEHDEISTRLASARPYRRLLGAVRPLPTGRPAEPDGGDLLRRQVAAGITREELSLQLRPTAAHAHEPVSSMGDDTALPPLAGRARPVFSYYRQRFAQVTNPPIDHLRERRVFSLRTLLGAQAPLLSQGAAPPLLELESFFLYPDAVAGAPLDATLGDETLEAALERVADAAEEAVRRHEQLLVVTDEHANASRAPIPSLLALRAVHRRLVARGLRTHSSLVVVADDVRDAHGCACLLGHGADAICPRLALETIAQLAATDKLGGDHPPPSEAQRRFRAALEDGVLKIMSKMGISDVAAYRGAELFDQLGLDGSTIGGVGLTDLERELRARHALAWGDEPELENPGYVKFRKGGEPHATNPDVVATLQAHALRKGDYARFAELVDGRAPMEVRDLLELVPAVQPVPLDEVEPVESIVRRFSSGAMSHGSLSAEAHETVAIAFNRLGARSNSGEGGEDPARFRDERNSRIKQIASGRFGVTPEYLAFADELQIKIAQGSKPGEGGQLPAAKVSEEIARLRHTEPGIQLISPPPHHDIYSIEDLAQLVFDLREAHPAAAVSVKLVAETGVGVVAVGVAKALADVIHVAGCDGGTGASPLSSIKNAGLPWEIGLAETHQALRSSGLRGRVRVRVDGGMKTGRDVVVALLLGADEVSFGTAVLLAEGCLMVRSCHLDTCPVGIATQRPELRSKFAGTPDQVAAYVVAVAEDVRARLAALGLRSVDDAVGRTDLLRPRESVFSLEALLAPAGGGYTRDRRPSAPGGELGERLALDAEPAFAEARIVDLSYDVDTCDRAVGARVGVRVAREFGSATPPGRVNAHFRGSAGQSFGAFLSAGVVMTLVGEANDYVGKGMGGGRIVIAPPPLDAGRPVLLGNTALYGATGGKLFCAGRAGERFAVRNSGATAVVEGVGDHACEYMTAGTVVVLGATGANLAAGMTGGRLLVHELDVATLNDELVAVASPDDDLLDELRVLLERHARYTGSPRATVLLEEWEHERTAFALVLPKQAQAAGSKPVSRTATG